MSSTKAGAVYSCLSSASAFLISSVEDPVTVVRSVCRICYALDIVKK